MQPPEVTSLQQQVTNCQIASVVGDTEMSASTGPVAQAMEVENSPVGKSVSVVHPVLDQPKIDWTTLSQKQQAMLRPFY